MFLISETEEKRIKEDENAIIIMTNNSATAAAAIAEVEGIIDRVL